VGRAASVDELDQIVEVDAPVASELARQVAAEAGLAQRPRRHMITSAGT
jgi:hypothetical protein